jgi:hypothetical protein
MVQLYFLTLYAATAQIGALAVGLRTRIGVSLGGAA